eukprot:4880720-Amphidinium_carterae.1
MCGGTAKLHAVSRDQTRRANVLRLKVNFPTTNTSQNSNDGIQAVGTIKNSACVAYLYLCLASQVDAHSCLLV